MGVVKGGGCWWNLWVWLVGVVVRRYIYIKIFIILLIPTPLVSVLFSNNIPTFCSFFCSFGLTISTITAVGSAREIEDSLSIAATSRYHHTMPPA